MIKLSECRRFNHAIDSDTVRSPLRAPSGARHRERYASKKEPITMTRVMQFVSLLLTFISLLAGCATNIGAPQTRDEFISVMRPGGLFRNAEKFNVSRPVKAVVADVTEYANKCLRVRATSKYNIKGEIGRYTTYLPKISTAPNGVTALSVQELYNDRVESGAPPGGIFTFAAELRAVGGKETQVEIYYVTGRDEIGKGLKRWSMGDRKACPFN